MEIDISEVYTCTYFYKYFHGNLCFTFKAKIDYNI